jgi:histidinol-phosphate aminotransferase
MILDEAYCDTAPNDAVPPIDVSNAQVLRFRTFSKAYGLAGARIGYAIGAEEVVGAFNRVRNHYGVNRVGQIGALAALADQNYLSHVVTKVSRARDRIGQIAADHGLRALPSATTFVAIDCGADGAFAERVLQALLDRDVFVRKPKAAGLDHLIRVSTGIDADLDVFAEQLPKALDIARGG